MQDTGTDAQAEGQTATRRRKATANGGNQPGEAKGRRMRTLQDFIAFLDSLDWRPGKLRELQAADPSQPVFIVEAKKSAELLRSKNLTAICHPQGDDSWTSGPAKALKDRHVVILPGNHDDGRKHAQALAKSLHTETASVRVLELPNMPHKGDVTDWAENGGSPKELVRLAGKTPEWSPPERFQWYDAKQLAHGNFKVNYHIPGILAERIPTIISGSFKTLKTSLAVDLHVSLCSGAPFLGEFHVSRPYRAALMSGESGMSALQSIDLRVANAKGWSLDQVGNLLLTPDLPRLSESSDVQEVERLIGKHKLECLIIDPAYLALEIDDAGNLFSAGKQLRPVAEIIGRTGCTIVIVHHNSKASSRVYEPAELVDMQWSDFAEFAGQWLLLSRREKYDPNSDGEHKLWMNVGGRPGHSGLWAVDVTEGRPDDPQGRRWEAAVKSASGARAEAAEARQDAQAKAKEREAEEKRRRDRERIIKALQRFPDGETKSFIRDTSGVDSRRFNPAFADLLDEQLIEPCRVSKGNKRTYDGFKLAENRTRMDSDSTRISESSDCTSTQSDRPPYRGPSECVRASGDERMNEEPPSVSECPREGIF